MFCTTIIPTIGRPELSRAIYSVLGQEFTADTFEIIVVNDSGQTLPVADWQNSPLVKMLSTSQRERSIARNTGAAIAKGRYLHFLDDDDWLLPGALQTFWELVQLQPQAAWLYGGTQLVNRSNEPVIQLNHSIQGNCFVQVMAGEWIPLQSSIIKSSDFFETGGFNPLISGPEDIDLCRRVLLRGELAGTDALISCIGMGEERSSTNYALSPKLGRWAREKILNEPGVFKRLQTSANTNYWHGRIVRLYLTSLVWNLRHLHIVTAINRGIFTLLAFVRSSWRMLSRSFWQAVLHKYQSFTFQRGFESSTYTPSSKNP